MTRPKVPPGQSVLAMAWEATAYFVRRRPETAHSASMRKLQEEEAEGKYIPLLKLLLGRRIGYFRSALGPVAILSAPVWDELRAQAQIARSCECCCQGPTVVIICSHRFFLLALARLESWVRSCSSGSCVGYCIPKGPLADGISTMSSLSLPDFSLRK